MDPVDGLGFVCPCAQGGVTDELGLLKSATSPGSSHQKGYIQDVSAGPASGE